MITREEFENLGPRARGYAVYMCGAREDEPHVPAEENPYPKGSRARAEWDLGQTQAMLHAQDSEE